jgi:hypothetical protein
MDFRQSVITGARGYFPGDYVGLATVGADFVAAFNRNNDLGLIVEFPQPPGLFGGKDDRTNTVLVRETPLLERGHCQSKPVRADLPALPSSANDQIGAVDRPNAQRPGDLEHAVGRLFQLLDTEMPGRHRNPVGGQLCVNAEGYGRFGPLATQLT